MTHPRCLRVEPTAAISHNQQLDQLATAYPADDETAPPSGRRPVAPNNASPPSHQAVASPDTSAPRLPLSHTLWGIDWRTQLPYHSAGLRVVPSSLEECRPFIQTEYATIFEEDQSASAFASDIGPFKERYYQLFGDFFQVQTEADGAPVGLLLCTPADWSSYYIRSAALLPQHQGSQIIQRFYANVLFPTLRAAGVERVELDVSPANLAMLHIVARLRFNPTGTVLSERWGALTHFTRFLDQDNEGVFLNQFCTGVKYQLRREGLTEERRSI